MIKLPFVQKEKMKLETNVYRKGARSNENYKPHYVEM